MVIVSGSQVVEDKGRDRLVGLLAQMARAAGNCMASVQVRYNPLTNVIGS